jgi:prepilin signal peptidase PulO-like enzyme (type II secretory pathway)
MIMFILFFSGAIIGSVMVIVGLRLPKKISLRALKSKCIKCSGLLDYRDLIPIVSFIMLKGRCKNCEKKISLKYITFEVLTGISFIFVYINAKTLGDFVFYTSIGCVLIVLSVADLEYRLVPNKILIHTFILLVPIGLWISDNSMLNHFIGGFSILVGLLLLSLLTRGGMGGGDVKLLALMGFTLGFQEILLIFMLACVFGLIVILGLKVFKRGVVNLPFVPFICVGYFVLVGYEQEIWRFLLYR